MFEAMPIARKYTLKQYFNSINHTAAVWFIEFFILTKLVG